MLNQKTILLVDDDERNIFAISAALKSYRPTIITAHNGAECLEKLAENNEIDLILLDMMMPVMDGYEALEKIRSDERTRHIPVISLTALAMIGDKEKCLEAGADDYCSKPIKISDLISRITKHLKT